ncbi:MAG: DMT family transporter [Chitinivibrionales bacterium]|nr:DMT family transporter [Chitinivibrionales bacterium]
MRFVSKIGDRAAATIAAHRQLSANITLLITATIWGFSFTAQRVGMEHLGPFTFNGVRFLLGTFCLLPLLRFTRRNPPIHRKKQIAGCLLIGSILFCATSLQQIGIVNTTAGKAGFITGMYVILVPLFGIALHRYTGRAIWIGSCSALVGLYLLSVTDTLTIQQGDLLVLLSAFFWAFHILAIDRFSQTIDSILIAVIQFFICGIVSIIIAVCTESIHLESVVAASIPILYSGILGIGVAFTLQIFGQRYAHPAYASIILSMESPIAAFGGWMLLGETFSCRDLLGSMLMLAGMIISQVKGKSSKNTS